MGKVCTTADRCPYQKQNDSVLNCSYDGYCDYQLPRDSRNAVTYAIADQLLLKRKKEMNGLHGKCKGCVYYLVSQPCCYDWVCCRRKEDHYTPKKKGGKK
jgi:hypothetical protein